jgi:hypothetical protein
MLDPESKSSFEHREERLGMYSRPRHVLALAAAALIAGCQSDLANQPPAGSAASAGRSASAGVPSVAREQIRGAAKAQRAPAMSPGAKTTPLLYVSDYTNSDVDVFEYPRGKRVGRLTTDLDYPQGSCTDKQGNLWITNSGKFDIVKYAHGGKGPIGSLDDPGYYPVSCSVNPMNGDLAVANIEQNAHGLEGNIAIYKGATGSPAYYSDDFFYSYYFVGYDNQGNLFFDGTNAEVGANGKFEFAELPAGSATPQTIDLTGGSIAFPGNVQWDGKEMTVGDQSNAVIYELSGSAIVGSTPLTGSSDVVQYCIHGKTVIGPDAGNATVEYFRYPAGGVATKKITGLAKPVAATISE